MVCVEVKLVLIHLPSLTVLILSPVFLTSTVSTGDRFCGGGCSIIFHMKWKNTAALTDLRHQIKEHLSSGFQQGEHAGLA